MIGEGGRKKNKTAAAVAPFSPPSNLPQIGTAIDIATLKCSIGLGLYTDTYTAIDRRIILPDTPSQEHTEMDMAMIMDRYSFTTHTFPNINQT
jgi:hypothetical protein